MRRVEAPLTKVLHSIASNKEIPLSGTFELSPICNFACRMCYVRKTKKEVEAHERQILKLEDWISIAESAREKGMLYLLLTGGEPLLWPDFWTLYERLSQMGFLISINTNGSLIDQEAINRFCLMPPAHINITLYGASDKTYESLCQAKGIYTRVINSILALKKAGITVKINCSSTPQNIHDLEKIVDFAKENRITLDVASYMFPPVRRDPSMIGKNERFTPQEAAYSHLMKVKYQMGQEYYLKYMHRILDGRIEPLGLDESCIDPIDGKIRCRAGKASFWITWDGYMTPCGMMPVPRTDIKKGFEQAWNETVEKSKEIVLNGLCNKCENHELCNSCAAMAYAETGSYSGMPLYLCEMVMEMRQIASQELNI